MTRYYWSAAPRRRPTAVPHDALRRRQGGRRGNLRTHSSPDEPDVPAHPGVLHSRVVTGWDTGAVMAAALGAGVPATGVVRAEPATDGTRSTTGCVL